MKTADSSHYTFLQELASPAQREHIARHMESIGMTPTHEPTIFAAPQPVSQIAAISDILDTSDALPLHCHTFIEIVYYVSGSGIEYLIGPHRYFLQKGDIVFVPPGVWHCTMHSPQMLEPCSRHLIVMNSSLIDNIGGAILKETPLNYEHPFLLRTAGTDREYLGSLFELCVRETSQREYRWRDMLIGCVYILLTQLHRAYRENALTVIKAEKAGLIENLLAYVDDNLKNKITLAEAAKHFYTSERTITREFQKTLGISFYRYVTQRRLGAARNLIQDGLPMETVCGMVGFSDYPTFYRAFKKEYGVSPRQMKNQNSAK